jgi:hypothetical protein
MLPHGELVTIVREVGGGTDDDGYPLPSKRVETPVEGCIIDERTTGITSQKDQVTVSQGVQFLLPGEHDLTAPNRSLWLVARGWEWEPDGEAFTLRSMFGSLVWTQAPVKKVRVA